MRYKRAPLKMHPGCCICSLQSQDYAAVLCALAADTGSRHISDVALSAQERSVALSYSGWVGGCLSCESCCSTFSAHPFISNASPNVEHMSRLRQPRLPHQDYAALVVFKTNCSTRLFSRSTRGMLSFTYVYEDTTTTLILVSSRIVSETLWVSCVWCGRTNPVGVATASRPYARRAHRPSLHLRGRGSRRDAARAQEKARR